MSAAVWMHGYIHYKNKKVALQLLMCYSYNNVEMSLSLELFIAKCKEMKTFLTQQNSPATFLVLARVCLKSKVGLAAFLNI